MKNMGLSVCLCPVISSVTVLFETDRKNWTAMMLDHKIKKTLTTFPGVYIQPTGCVTLMNCQK